MKKSRYILCFTIAFALIVGCCGSAFADESPPEASEAVEEAIDEVALAEAEAEARAQAEAEAKAEAEKVADVFDIDETEEKVSETPEASGAEKEKPAERQGISGSYLALIVGLVLIVLGGAVILASSRKIRKGKAKK